ncbi:hypothetical protein CF327_g1327 [Tilletia walkeri]|nr:hypothetical protein CF327_g1327 [Tilletia walkeri]
MERIASRQWHRLRLSIGRSAIRIPSGAAVGRTISSSSSSSAATAARRRDAEAVAVEQAAEEARPAGMSAKAWGKQRQRSEAVEVVELPSPYPQGSASHKTLLADIEVLMRSATAAQDGQDTAPAHSAQSWLQVLSAPSASYALSAPYLLSTGAFYQPPLQGPGGRALLARLHSHLMASQIHSVSDAELALKVLNRHCVLGTTQVHSVSAWPPIVSQASTSGSNFINAAEQQQLISTYSRNVDLTLNTISVALERILRDLGATHLVLACAELVVQLAVRFRAQIGPASSLQPRRHQSRHRSTVVQGRPSAYKKARNFHRLFLRLAHLIPHRSDRRNLKAASQLLKSVVVLCNVHLKLDVVKYSKMWPPYSTITAMRLSETRASNLPRKRARRQALFSGELCRDVARALLDAPAEDEARTVRPSGPSGLIHSRIFSAVTIPRREWVVNDHGEVISTSFLGLRSTKRPEFLSFALARACVFAVHAAVMNQRRKRSDTFQQGHLCAADYDAALRSLMLHGPETKHNFNVEHVAKVFLSLIKRTEDDEAAWCVFSNARVESCPNPHQGSRSAYYLHALRKQAEVSWVGDSYAKDLGHLHRRRIRKVIRDSAGHVLGTRCPSLWASDEVVQQPIEEMDHSKEAPERVEVSLEFIRVALRALGRDPKIQTREIAALLGIPESVDAKEDEGAGFSATSFRNDAQSLAQVIFGLTLRTKRHPRIWAMIDAIWNAAVERRRHMIGSFDHISLAYLRSQWRRFEQTPLGGGKGAILSRALGQVWEQARLKPGFYPQEQQRHLHAVSIRLATDMISTTGSNLGQTATALKFWQVLQRDQPETAFAWGPFSAMLNVVTSAERTRMSKGGEGLPWRRIKASDGLMTGMAARQLFRQVLFRQHPALAQWSEGAPRNPLADVEAGGSDSMGGFSLFGSILLKAKIRGGRFLPWAQSFAGAEDVGQSEGMGVSLLATSTRQRPPYVNFNAAVFEAYISLLHTMTVPNSQLVQAATRTGAPVYPHAPFLGDDHCLPTHMASDPIAAQTSQTQAPANQKRGKIKKAHTDSAALEPPTHDELLLVFAWMRALRVRPSRATLYILCIHLIETLPPGLIRPGQPTGPLTEWLEKWLGWRSLPSEEQVVGWLKQTKSKIRKPGSTRM